MTSFGVTKVIQENFMPTFKIQGRIYHQNNKKFIFFIVETDCDTSDII